MQILLYILIAMSCYILANNIVGRGKSIIIAIFFISIFIFLINSASVIADSENYILEYSGVIFNKRNPLYDTVQNIFVGLNLSFDYYKGILYFICYVLIFRAIRKINVNPYKVFFPYLFCVFFTDVVQIRNFMGVTLLTLGVISLLSANKFSKLLFFICCSFACMFHTSFVVYYIFLIPMPKNKNKYHSYIKKYAVFLGMLFAICFFAKSSFSQIFMLFSSYDSEKFLQFTRIGTNFGSLIVFLPQIYTIVMFVLNLKCIENDGLEIDESCKKILFFNVLALALCCFSVLDTNFYRLIRNIVLINMTGLAYLSNYNYKKSKSVLILNQFYFVVWISVDVFALNSFDKLIIPFFNI